MRAASSIWTFVVLWNACFVGLFIHMLGWLTVPFDRRRRFNGNLNRWIAQFVVRMNPLWRVRVVGEVPTNPGAAVVVSNHCSNADAFLIAHVPWPLRWLAKDSLLRIPVVGWCMAWGNVVPIKRGDRASIGKAMADCGQWLQRDVPVMIFPEGTRSKTAEMLPFKDGAFRLAIDHQVPLCLMAVHGTRTALRKHDWRLGRADATVIVGETIATEGMGRENVEALKARAREGIEALREQLRERAQT